MATQTERRRAYRAAVAEEELAVRVVLGGAAQDARLLDLTSGGAGVALGLEQPVMVVGNEAELRFKSPDLKDEIRVKCTVRHRIDTDDERRYGFEFDENPELGRTSKLHQLFNRRGAVRVEPRAGESILAELSFTSDVRLVGKLLDVSSGGAAVLVSQGADHDIAHKQDAELSMALPTGGDVTIRCIIRQRVLQPEGLRIGVQFDDKRTAGYQQEQERVTAYVMERQRENQAAYRHAMGERT